MTGIRPGPRTTCGPAAVFAPEWKPEDGSFGFDFGGIYDDVRKDELIEYTLGDGRKVSVRFIAEDQSTRVVETFDAEAENPAEMQRQGWQSILDRFKKYTEDQFAG